jgi:hypothetical protein
MKCNDVGMQQGKGVPETPSWWPKEEVVGLLKTPAAIEVEESPAICCGCGGAGNWSGAYGAGSGGAWP